MAAGRLRWRGGKSQRKRCELLMEGCCNVGSVVEDSVEERV
jgi:hypothetical protein